MEVANLTAVIDANTGGFTRAMRRVDGDLNSTSDHMRRIDGDINRTSGSFSRFGAGMGRTMAIGAAAVATFGVAAGVAAGVGLYKSIQSASDLNETVSKTKVIFGKSSKDILAWSNNSAKALGQSRTQALGAAATFAVFGKSAGLSGKDLTGFSKELTGLSADLASFHNASPEETITAIGAALRGESEPIRRFGVLLDDASLRAEAMKQGLISTTKDALTPQQRALAAHALIMKQTKDAQGDFARTSGGLANQQRIFNAELENAKIAIGTGLLPLATAIMPKLTAAIPVVTEYISQFTTALQQTIGQFTGANGGMSDLTTKANSLFQQLRGYAIPVMDSFGKIMTTVGQVAQRIAPALSQYLGAAILAIGKISAAVMPVVASAFEELAPPIARLSAVMLKFSALMLNVLGTVIPPIVRALAPIFTVAFHAIGQIINAIAALLEGDFTGAFRSAKEAIRAIWITLPNMLIGVLVKAIGALAGVAADLGGKIIDGIANAIATGAGKIGSAISGAIKDAITNIDIPGFSPPEHAAAEAIGSPLARGVVLGFLNGTATLPDKISERLKAALERGKATIERQQGVMQSAFGRLGAGVMRAFDAQTQRGSDAIRAQGAALTPAEAELERTRAARDAQTKVEERAAANAALAAAQTEGNAQAIADARRRIADLDYADTLASLEKKAAAERAARDAETASKVLNYEAQREVERQRQEDELARLSAFLDKRNATFEQKQRALNAFLNGKSIKDAMAASGTNLGTAFADALNATKGKVTAAVKTLGKLVQDYLRLRSPAKKGALSTLDTWWTPMPKTLLSGVDASMMGQVAAGIAAPDSGAYGGANGGAGTTVINVTVQGTVTSERDLVDTIRTELLRTGQRNGSIFGGLA